MTVTKPRPPIIAAEITVTNHNAGRLSGSQLARGSGDETRYRDYRDRYRAIATSLGFGGHMNWAEAMP